jgi:hypothetical protein
MEKELQKIYDSEINVQIYSFWDAEWRVAVMVDGQWKHPSGYDIVSHRDIIPALQDAIKEHLPESKYAKDLLS